MAAHRMDRKSFLALGMGTCMCGAASAMSAAFAGETARPARAARKPAVAAAAPTRPGEKSAARAAKRMEFVDGWVPRLFQAIDDQLDEPTRRRLMAANGRACFASFAPPLKAPPEPFTREAIAAWVAERAQRGYSKDGDAILFEFTGSAETGGASPERLCLCPTVEAQRAGTISPTYCWCSVGYVKEMHERAFGRAVAVELLESVLGGAKRCRFRMTLA